MQKCHAGLKPTIKNSLHLYKSKTLAKIIDHAKTWELEHGQPKFLEKKNGMKNTSLCTPNLNSHMHSQEDYQNEFDYPKKPPFLSSEASKFQNHLYPKLKPLFDAVLEKHKLEGHYF